MKTLTRIYLLQLIFVYMTASSQNPLSQAFEAAFSITDCIT